MPPWPSAVAEPRIPGPGRRSRRPSRASSAAACSAPGTLIASDSPPYAARGADVAAEQPALAKLGDVARERRRAARRPASARSRPSAPAPRRARPRRPARAARAGSSTRTGIAPGGPLPRGRGAFVRHLDRLDRVLERGVVELHHVAAVGRPGASRPRVRLTWTTSKPPEPSSRSSASTLTTTSSPSRHLADHAHVGPGRGGPRSPTADRQRVGRRRRVPRRSFSTARSAASQTASISVQRARALTDSSGVWLASVPFASSTAS